MGPGDLCGIKKFDSLDSAKTELESLCNQFRHTHICWNNTWITSLNVLACATPIVASEIVAATAASLVTFIISSIYQLVT